MLKKEDIILVTGATGSQGGAVAAALLKNGNRVRIMVRSSSVRSTTAEDLKKAGAEIMTGDMEDPASVEAALQGIYGLFSVQGMDDGSDSERRHVDTLVAAAVKRGVQHIVHASVNRTGEQESFPGWNEDRWNKKYWLDKEYGEETVRYSGIPHWTIVRPVFFMDNLIPPKVAFLFPHLAGGELLTAYKETTKLQLVAVEDIGTFAMAAFNDLTRFDRQTISLVGAELTMTEIAAFLNGVTAGGIRAVHVSEEEAVKRGIHPALANAHEWNNYVGYNVDMDALKKYGLPVTSFKQWLEKNCSLLLL